MAETDWDRDLDLKEVFAFVSRMGAVSIKETKDHFRVSSKAMRRAFARLWFADKILLYPFKRTVYIIENDHQRGNKNVKKLWAKGHREDGTPTKNDETAGLMKFTDAQWEAIQERITAEKQRRARDEGDDF